jgi:hypothetical protein
MELLRQFDIERVESQLQAMADEGMTDEELQAYVREGLAELFSGQPLWLCVVDEYYRRAMSAESDEKKRYFVWQAQRLMTEMNQAVM